LFKTAIDYAAHANWGQQTHVGFELMRSLQCQRPYFCYGCGGLYSNPLHGAISARLLTTLHL